MISEIDEVYSGVLPPVRIQSNCRCPPTHPRESPLQTTSCIANGEPVTTSTAVARLNINTHPLEFVNDGDVSTFWISTTLEHATISVNLGDIFQVCRFCIM